MGLIFRMHSRKQVRLMWVGAVLILAMAIFPPWEYTYENEGVRSAKPARYGLIFAPPSTEDTGTASGIRLDVNRLLVQWAAALTLVGACIVTVSKQRD